MSNKDLAVIEKKLLPVHQQIESLVVKDEKSEKVASEMLSQLNLIGDAMKEKKDKVYGPAYATVVAIRNEWKPRETMLQDAIALVRSKISKYRTEAKRIADEKEAKIAARVGEGKGKLKIETAVQKIEELDRPSGNVTTEAGMVKFKTVKKFEVTNLSALATYADGGYVVPNETAIRKAMLADIEVPGVRYYTEEVPLNYR